MSASAASGSANSRRRPAAASDMKERNDKNEDSKIQLPNSNEKSPKPGWMTLLRYLLWFIVLVVLVRIIMEGRMARLESRVGDLELRLNELKSKGLLTKEDAMKDWQNVNEFLRGTELQIKVNPH